MTKIKDFPEIIYQECEAKSPRTLDAGLRMVAWEVTRSCNLNCGHCRAAADCGPYQGELLTKKCFHLLNEIAAFAKPVIILTGGEPLLRTDIYDIASYGTSKGLRMVLATNGLLVDDKAARHLKASGIKRVSISLDGKDAQSHDTFRGQTGAFAGALKGIASLKNTGLEFQINTTVTAANLHQVKDIMELAVNMGAAAHHIFLLVPTGRGRDLAKQAITAKEYEETLHWFYNESLTSPIQLKATCAPHYFRILHQQKEKKSKQLTDNISTNSYSTGYRDGKEEATQSYSNIRRGADGDANNGSRMKTSWYSESTRGCLGGISFCFISHIGQVQPCGYLEVDCGNVQRQSFRHIWETSEVLRNLRDLNNYKGKCGRCEFSKVCGGCRARAYEATGDYLAEEPLCLYEPGR
ncbi:MAG TPA: radical SAM protein [Smithellaceae bacterium]|nr:radical SAM protein [Smithellaceae bacterium]